MRVKEMIALVVTAWAMSSAHAGLLLTAMDSTPGGVDATETSRCEDTGGVRLFGDTYGCHRPRSVMIAGAGVVEHVEITVTFGNFTGWLHETSLVLDHEGITVRIFSPFTHICQHIDAPVDCTFQITFDDLAPELVPVRPTQPTGTFKPDNPLGAFNGTDAGGTWTLYFGDYGVGDPTSYRGLVLRVTAVSEPAPLALLGLALAGLGFARRRKVH